MSFLNEVVDKFSQQKARESFVESVFENTGISKDALFEAYDTGLKEGGTTHFAKAEVYKFINEVNDSTEMPQGKFRIWDKHNKTWVGKTYNNWKRARTRVDKLDNEYGGYRYNVKKVDEESITEAFNNTDEIILEDDQNFNELFGVLGFVENDPLWEAEYQGRTVELNKPIRSSDGPKKFHVYVKNPKGNVVKVNFGDPDMEIKADNPKRRKSFRARHNCDNPGPKHKARYWSCKKW